MRAQNMFVKQAPTSIGACYQFYSFNISLYLLRQLINAKKQHRKWIKMREFFRNGNVSCIVVHFCNRRLELVVIVANYKGNDGG